MIALNAQTKLIGGAILAGVLLSWMFGVKSIAKTTTKAAVGLAVGTALGVEAGVGEALHVPESQRNLSQCQQALADGRKLDAARSCAATISIPHQISNFLHSFID